MHFCSDELLVLSMTVPALFALWLKVQRAILFVLFRLPARMVSWLNRQGIRVEVKLEGFDETRLVMIDTAKRLVLDSDALALCVRRLPACPC